jgi:hypothetical protein
MKPRTTGRLVAILGLAFVAGLLLSAPRSAHPLRILAVVALALGAVNLVVVFRPAFAEPRQLRPLIAAIAFSGTLAGIAGILLDGGRAWAAGLFGIASFTAYHFLARPILRELRARTPGSDSARASPRG